MPREQHESALACRARPGQRSRSCRGPAIHAPIANAAGVRAAAGAATARGLRRRGRGGRAGRAPRTHRAGGGDARVVAAHRGRASARQRALVRALRGRRSDRQGRGQLGHSPRSNGPRAPENQRHRHGVGAALGLGRSAGGRLGPRPAPRRDAARGRGDPWRRRRRQRRLGDGAVLVARRTSSAAAPRVGTAGLRRLRLRLRPRLRCRPVWRRLRQWGLGTKGDGARPLLRRSSSRALDA
mmetsp:Transcript_111687/g.360476  ORF Transcript_111687/g.360476 Transcript_111687/m.360476 type:complete len:240 (-) Transcript_111687:487-1206(-)